MNILLSAYSFGAWRGSEAGVGWNVAKGLAERGHKVTVLTTPEFHELNVSALEKVRLPIALIEVDC
ncbi:MAG: glycosyltransferase, partial [Akkermansia sp.]